MKKRNRIMNLIILVISLVMVLSMVIIKNEKDMLLSKEEKNEKDMLLSKEEKNEIRIKYLEYVEDNGYSVSGVKFIINIDEEIMAKKYYLSQETQKYEEIDKQSWDKQKWINFEEELYDSGLESWKIEQADLDKKQVESGGWLTDGNTYKLSIVFNDDSKLELSAYWYCVFDIEEILNKYFSNS